MVRRLPIELEQEILSLLLQGASYRTIGCKFGNSISSVARVAEDARKKTVDFDSLRAVTVLLRKAGLSVFDVTRAHALLESMNKWGVGVDELGDYVRMNERFLSAGTLNEDLLFYAVKLVQLEQVSGRTYQEAVEDFEKKRREAAEAEVRKAALENEALGLTVELRDTKKNLAEIKSEIEKATAVQQGLTELGVDKLAQLVRFVQDFESVGFDVGQMKRLAVWRRELEKLHIDPDGLGRFIAEKGPLDAQNNSLRFANERIKADVNAQVTQRATLVARNSVLQAVDRVLTTRTFTMPCRSCGYPLPIALPTKECLRDLIDAGQALNLGCRNCGVRQLLSPWEISLQIAWTILPTDMVTI